VNDYILRPSLSLQQVYLYRKPVDFRKSYRGLAVIVEQELGHNPFSGQLYVFINRHRNRLKCLFWENNGFVLYYKALAEERFRWPDEDQTLLTVTGQQLNWLLDGYAILQLRGHKRLHYESIS
jgi:transposase